MMDDILLNYFKNDIQYLCHYRNRLISLAKHLSPPDSTFLLSYSTVGIAQELAFCQSAVSAAESERKSKSGETEVSERSESGSEGPPLLELPADEAAVLTELASLTPCFTVYASRKPFSLYASDWFQTAAAQMQAIFEKYRARYPQYAKQMDAAFEAASKQENATLDSLRIDR